MQGRGQLRLRGGPETKPSSSDASQGWRGAFPGLLCFWNLLLDASGLRVGGEGVRGQGAWEGRQGYPSRQRSARAVGLPQGAGAREPLRPGGQGRPRPSLAGELSANSGRVETGVPELKPKGRKTEPPPRAWIFPSGPRQLPCLQAPGPLGLGGTGTEMTLSGHQQAVVPGGGRDAGSQPHSRASSVICGHLSPGETL